jgi:hypothetical protein
MKTERLEELAAKCAVAIDGVGCNASYGLSDSDLHDLARCALAWAKLERWVEEHEQVAELYGYRGRDLPWSFYPNSSAISTRFTGATAIEAVEAAEVGK